MPPKLRSGIRSTIERYPAYVLADELVCHRRRTGFQPVYQYKPGAGFARQPKLGDGVGFELGCRDLSLVISQ